MPKTLIAASRPPPVGDQDAAPQPARSRQSLIQWPTKQEILKVSEQLLMIQRVAIGCEADGDSFKSGDLAYQIQEIIRATAELSKKSQRAKR